MFRRRSRERFIGSYDPEHEMPDPRRRPGDRWESEAYRRNARDTRFAYRRNPDRIESPWRARRAQRGPERNDSDDRWRDYEPYRRSWDREE
ncbi:MAG: hypothetical protein ACRD2J_12180 [Thermoanaerobaculia bacterium]